MGVEPNPEAKDNRWPAPVRSRRTVGLPTEREFMFYVILIIVAVIAAAALLFMRGRRSV